MRNRLSRIMAAPFVWLIRGYQRFISPLTGAHCRFYPTCSAYALTAYRRFGPVKGTWLTFKRLVKCHPFHPGGVDHVPPAKPRHHDGDVPSGATRC